MTKIGPDIIARVKLFSQEEGSPRNLPIGPPYFNCPFEYKGNKFDCRLILEKFSKPIELGSCIEVPIVFAFPSYLVPSMKLGDRFLLWEGGIIGEGSVLEIMKPIRIE